MKKFLLSLFFLNYLIIISCFATSENEEWITKREWSYLTSEVFKTRYAIAAHLLRDCNTIIEIGGYKTPINDFVDNKNIIVIDPKIAAKNDDKVIHLPIKFQDWNGQISNKNYAVVILGLDLHLDDKGWHKLFDLINGSEKAVIGFSSTYKPANEQFKYICENINKTVSFIIKLDLSKNDASKFSEFYPFREIYCLT